MSSVLPAAHAVSGCDTVSPVFGKGKKKVWRQLKKRTAEVLKLLSSFADQDIVEMGLIARNLVAKL